MLKLKLVVATLLVASTTVALAAVPTPKVCHDGFKLKGKTDTAWKDVTLNAWNGKMLPVLWTDKGGHFLSQVKKRGNDVAIQTPGDLESFLRGTTAVLDPQDGRYHMGKNEGGKSVQVIFDINAASKKCELVTFLIKSAS
ncbi:MULTISPECIES: hypothetical protein [unclassified Janthinobacterium]|uniref:hypothetical protein n=1 Tax=unclassified Janthinobacterium TaxID=2610881 RepID=UPI0018CAAD7D|nr:hypothetical protein [Janthinobacterium sp. CG_23.4]MDH6155932.1 hypothetical protein [Janthinobacterium sp. CG_23.4]